MAYVPFSDEDQNKQNTAQPQTGTGSAMPTTGGGGGGATPAGAPGQTAPQSGAQGFANINQYLTANKDQAPNVAASISSNLQNQYTGLQGDINNAANQAGEAIKGATTAYDPNLIDRATSNSSPFVADPNNLAAWQKQYNAAYTGPTSFETSAGYGQAANAANKAAQTYQLGQTGGGYTQLLNQIEKNPTAGRTALDKSLIQADPNSQQTIQGALSPFKGIQDYVSGKSAEIGKQATEAAKTTGEAATKSHEALTGATASLANQVDKQYQTGLANQSNYNKQVQDLQKQYAPYEDLINRYETGTGQDYGDPFQFYKQFTQNQDAITKESQANPDQFANEAALEKLGGQPLNILYNNSQPDLSQYRNTDAYKAVTDKLNSGEKLTNEELALFKSEGQKPVRGEYGTVPGLDAAKLDINSGQMGEWYRNALTDAAKQTGWTPETKDKYNTGNISAVDWLRGIPSQGNQGEGHANARFNQLLNELNKLNPNIRPL